METVYAIIRCTFCGISARSTSFAKTPFIGATYIYSVTFIISGSVFVSVCLSVCMNLFASLSLSLSLSPSVSLRCMFVYLSVCLFPSNEHHGRLSILSSYKKNNAMCVSKSDGLVFQVADELADKWTKMGSDSKIPLTQHTSLFALKAIVHTLFGNIMRDDSKEELDFRSEADEVI